MSAVAAPQSLTWNVSKAVSDELAATGLAFVAPGTLPRGCQQPFPAKIQCKGQEAYISLREEGSVVANALSLNVSQRKFLGAALSDKVVVVLDKEILVPSVRKVSLEVAPYSKGTEKMTCEAKKVVAAFREFIAGKVLTLGLPVAMLFAGKVLVFTPRDFGEAQPPLSFGKLDEEVEVTLKVDPPSQNLQLTGLGTGAIKELNLDFKGLGVGGLDRQLQDILTRAFYSRRLGEDLVAKYGLEHAKGILLYGPPGTGKTLIARTIAEMFKNTKIKLVNGPELFDKYVGASEKNLREVFSAAVNEWQTKGAESDLHVIIFDEIDALFKQRGSTHNGTGVGDTIVNQMLTLLDGVDSPKNFLVIGMTNRKDLLDDALLRKGRIGIHIQIALPDEQGRREILDIHTKKLRENALLDPEVDLGQWAKRTVNFSGADLKGLINEATYLANARNFDSRDGHKPVLKDFRKEKPEAVTSDDFEQAFKKVLPSFGIAVNKLEPYVKRQFVPFNDAIQGIIESTEEDFLTLQATQGNPTRCILLSGIKGVGKTALAVHLAVNSKAPFVSLITSGDLAGLSESERIHRLDAEFKKTQQSKYSVLVLDNLEGILGATRDGRSYLTQTVLKLEALLSDPAYENLLVIGTSSYTPFLEEVGLLSNFKNQIVQPVTSYQQIVTILTGLGLSTEKLVLPQQELRPIAVKDLLDKVRTFKALNAEAAWNTTAFLRTL